MRFTRRRFVQAAGAAAVGLSLPLKAQAGPIRLGLMTVKTGPLASGGIDMERALVMYLRERAVALAQRSEEHTSELQSRLHLVCRLLLEKKKKKRSEARL